MKSRREESQVERYRRALEDIMRHIEISMGGKNTKLSATWQIAKQALQRDKND